MRGTTGNIKIVIGKIRGKWRLMFGFCPACNSDAPKLYDCQVCQWYRTSDRGMPSKTIKRVWWERFIAGLNIKYLRAILVFVIAYIPACTATRQTFVATESRSSVVAARDSAKWVCADESAVRKYFIEYGRDTLHFVVIDSVLPGKHTYAYPLPDTAGYVRIHAAGLADSYTKSIFYTKNKVTITNALYNSTVLKWTVSNEKNVTGYLIEKTSDNRTWSKTTQIPDRGNGTYNYRYSKTKVKYQYRLTPIFLDASKGTATIFK